MVIGLSLSGVHQAETLRHALTVKTDHERLFDAVQATWNLLEPSAGKVLQEAHAEGLAVIIKEGLANGRLTERNNASDFSEQLDMLRKVAKTQLASVDAVALAAILAQPWVGVVLSGAATQEHLMSNTAAVGLALGDVPDLAESPDEYWATRSALAWN